MSVLLLLATTLVLGAPLGTLEVRDAAGHATELAALAQHDVVVVNIWAVWCPPCREELPWMLDLHASGAIQLIAVNFGDRPADVRRFLRSAGLDDLPVRYVSSRAVRGVDLPGLPTTFVSVRGGRTVTHYGPLTPEALERLVSEASWSTEP